jgi:hypothetical protein
MGLRERVRHAIKGPVEESHKLLDEAPNADVETKVSILVNGWFRGISAALEELAIAIDDLREGRSISAPDSGARRRVEEPKPPEPTVNDSSDEVSVAALADERLIDEARKSSEETAELRKEAEQLRRDLEQ